VTAGAYRSRLERDLPRWRDQGWVTAEGAAAIVASLGPPRATLRMSGLVAVLGALLLSVGVIGLVAANWEAIPRIVRFWMLIATMGASYAAAALLQTRRHALFAEAALLLAGLVFAGSIALIGQSYHLAGEFSDAVLMWTLGCAAAALLTGSIAQTVLTTVGAAFWTGLLAVEIAAPPHIPSLALALAALSVATWIGSRPARCLAILGLGFWIAVAVITAAQTYKWMPGGALALLAVVALAFWMTGAALASRDDGAPRLAALGADLGAPALPAFLLALGFLQIAPRLDASGSWETWFSLAILALGAGAAGCMAAVRAGVLAPLDAATAAALGAGSLIFARWTGGGGFLPQLLGCVLVLSACLWTVSLGYRGIHRGGRSLGLTAFALEVAYVYAITFGTVLDTALALLGGGALFLLVAVALFRIDRRLSARDSVAPLEGASA
jgi:uncharacterized membrane protein